MMENKEEPPYLKLAIGWALMIIGLGIGVGSILSLADSVTNRAITHLIFSIAMIGLGWAFYANSQPKTS